ncbi:unnamed protein product [Parajaminaea phylloscopi]
MRSPSRGSIADPTAARWHVAHKRPSSTGPFVSLSAALFFAAAGYAGLHGYATPLSSQEDTCSFSYAAVHIYFTIPPTVLLYLINRPFQTQLDRAKLILLPIIAFVWTTPWDNELVRQRAWRYPKSCVLGTIGYVPVEEYLFFIIQSVLSTLWTSFLTRWLLPTLYLVEDERSSAGGILRLPRASTSALLVCGLAICLGLLASRPGQHSYYLGMISWWCAMPLGLLGWGSANYIARCLKRRAGLFAFAMSLCAPTVYLWAVDVFALRRGTWHINEETSLNIFPIPDLPIEEMVFFTVTNLLLVVACFTFDRCICLARLGIGVTSGTSDRLETSRSQTAHVPYSPSYLPLTATTITSLWRTFIANDPHGSEPARSSCQRADGKAELETLGSQTQDLRSSLSILAQASKSFSLASLLLPWDLRTDLCVLYAFCRAADDCIDDGDGEQVQEGRPAHDLKKQRMAVLSSLVDAIYRGDLTLDQTRAGIRDMLDKLGRQEDSSIEPDISEKLRASACAVVALRHLLPRSLWDELLQGYQMDVEMDLCGKEARLKSMADLVEYAQCVAGCVGEMCVRVVLGRCGNPVGASLQELGLERSIEFTRSTKGSLKPLSTSTSVGPAINDTLARPRHLIYNARRMGVALQLVNVARDIVEDSRKLKRCYLPEELLVCHGYTEEEAVEMQHDLFSGHVDLAIAPEAKVPSAPGGVSPKELHLLAIDLLDIARSLYDDSLPALRSAGGGLEGSTMGISSRPTRSGLRAACSVYFALASSIEAQSEQQILCGQRARLSRWRRILVALKAVYLG